DAGPGAFAGEVGRLAAHLAALPATGARIAAKKTELERRESEPLAAYRERELARMRMTFDDPDAPYHALRRAFVHKTRPAGTPAHLAASQTDPGPSAAGFTGTAPHDSPSRFIG
ncbi:hydrogenase maturation protein, partial [Streptomyces sp. NPDC052127]